MVNTVAKNNVNLNFYEACGYIHADAITKYFVPIIIIKAHNIVVTFVRATIFCSVS